MLKRLAESDAPFLPRMQPRTGMGHFVSELNDASRKVPLSSPTCDSPRSFYSIQSIDRSIQSRPRELKTIKKKKRGSRQGLDHLGHTTSDCRSPLVRSGPSPCSLDGSNRSSPHVLSTSYLRYRAQRALYRVKSKGGLKNIDSFIKEYHQQFNNDCKVVKITASVSAT